MNTKLCDLCGARVENGYSLTPPTQFLGGGAFISQRTHDFCDKRCLQLWLEQREIVVSAGEEEK